MHGFHAAAAAQEGRIREPEVADAARQCLGGIELGATAGLELRVSQVEGLALVFHIAVGNG